MTITNRKEQALLLVGDMLLFFLALWATLALRSLELPDMDTLYNHALPFSLLFIVWVLVFFIAGLYDKHTVLFQRKLPSIILNTQVANVIIAALFFFSVPYFGITPKTVLAIYLVISFVFITTWRLYIFPSLRFGKQEKAILVGSGREAEELRNEVNENRRYGFEFMDTFHFGNEVNPNDVQKRILERVAAGDVSVIVANLRHGDLEPLLPLLYNLTFLNLSFRFVDINQLYEDIFDRVPLSLVNHEWFLENVTIRSHVGYEALKRTTDVVAALILGVLSLAIYPLVWIAIRLDDGGPLFIAQERIGLNNRPIRILKFRSMTGNDEGADVLKSRHVVTRVGKYIRKTRIDELPQLWSVLRGDQSLIGPRPELPELVKHYAERIPYYNTRHLIKPGLSGWAQINHQGHPHHGSDVTETKNKLS
ncbi:MAG TPA: sugar transferase, partial [Candidatus Paceibacterota bacterium]